VNFSIAGGTLPWLILGILAAALVAVWAYRFVLPPLSSQTRGMLWAFRALALAILILLIARPLFSLAERSRDQEIVILEDYSLSMSLPESGGEEDRAAVAARAADELEEKLGGRYPVRRWVFAASATEAVGDSTAALDRAATALGDAVHSLSQRGALAGVVVVSDGVANRGRDPVQAARELGCTVSAVVVGSAGEWDASLEEIAVNPTARAGQSTPMEVRLSHSGESPRRAQLVVSDAQGVLAEKEVLLPAGGSEIIERLTFVPRQVGLSYYRVRLETGPTEAVLDNNLRAVVQQVLPDRQRVLVLAQELNWDWTWLKRTLDADSAWAVEYGVWRNGRFQPPPGPAQATSSVRLTPMDRYAVIIAQGFGPNWAPGAQLQQLVEYARRGGGLVFWGGTSGADDELAAWFGSAAGRSLGLRPLEAAVPTQVIPELPLDGRLHDIVRLDEDPELNERYFAGLPPLQYVSPIERRPGDRPLVTGAGGRASLMVLRRLGRGQVLLINGGGLWRWGFSGSDRLAPQRYRRFWAHALRALAEPTQTEPLRVTTDRPLLARGQDVGVTASLQDEDFQPVSGAEVEARWIAVSGLDGGRAPEIEGGAISLVDQEDGSYAGVRPPLPPGRYRVEARARRGGQVVANASSEFVVDSWSPEVQAVVPDRATLERMAQASGGEVATADGVDELARNLAAADVRPSSWREYRLWENPLFYLLILGFLSTEWWLRRRRGLP
jgi:hypothetical protein